MGFILNRVWNAEGLSHSSVALHSIHVQGQGVSNTGVWKATVRREGILKYYIMD